MRLAGLAIVSSLPLLAETGYQKPPKEVLDVLNVPPPPSVSVSPTRTHLLLLQGVRYPPIADVARPMLRLAGLRIDPKTNGPHTSFFTLGLTLKRVDDGAETKIALPADARLLGGFFSPTIHWSPDGKQFAFLNVAANGIELWLGDTASGKVRQASGVVINAVLGDPVQWTGGSRMLLLRLVSAQRGLPPAPPTVPAGPNIQQSAGRSAPVRTYQDLLTGAHDEALFDYYATTQLATFDTATGKLTMVGPPALYQTAEPSPDGRHLLVSRLKRPYSYLHPASAFPQDVEVWDGEGRMIRRIASLALAEVPIDGVRVGPRALQWDPTRGATLTWTEALDGGNPKETVPHRDRVLVLSAPFTDEPREQVKLQHRFAGLQWTETGLVAVSDYERDSRRSRLFLLDPKSPTPEPRLVFDRNVQDRYRHPGSPLSRMLPNGHTVLAQPNGSLLLAGQGASPQGDRPFLDRLDLATLKTERLFHSAADRYEAVVGLLDEDGTRVLVSRESPTEPPNLFVRNTKTGELRALTNFPDPTPQLRGITKQLVTYARADGVPLSFTLYLPPNHQKGTRLPTVVWAYPQEYNDADTAGQVGGSTQRFTTLVGYTHLFFLLQGYAVLDGAAMPVVGTPETVNNTYIEQVVSSAKAAIDKAVEMGVTDPDRVGVGGHSYGAFMTANLLAHSDLFRAGIARSGAYNRTLTPFGFQSERRTFWEAPEVYLRMSPFLEANKIREPILLIHGEADNNTGTFLIQSERMYQAIRGNGGTVRYVTLPHESHGYAARESVEHVLYEMLGWFDHHVKNAGARAGTDGGARE